MFDFSTAFTGLLPFLGVFCLLALLFLLVLHSLIKSAVLAALRKNRQETYEQYQRRDLAG